MSVGRRLEFLARSEDAGLDRLMAVVATVDARPPQEAAVVNAFDDLASGLAPGAGVDDVLRHVFGDLGFRGATSHYYSASNSLIHRVLDRRIGIPLSLAVVAIEIGRRAGVGLAAVGLPGHVVLTSHHPGETVSREWFDPFDGGRRLERSECETILQRVRPTSRLLPQHLEVMSSVDIVARTLENLRVACLRSGDVSQLAAVLELRASLPGAPFEFRVELSKTLAALGRYDAAASLRDELATLQPSRSHHHEAEAVRLRAHRN